MPTDIIPRKYIFTRKLRTSLKPEISDTGSKQNNIHIYTDGSLTKSGAGVGIYCKSMSLKKSTALGKSMSTPTKVELVGILYAAKETIDRKIKGKKVHIITDCRAAISAISSCKITSALTLECCEALEKVASDNEVTLCWVKGHRNSKGNKKADELARKASSRPIHGPGPALPPSLQDMIPLLKNTSTKLHRERWDNTTGCRVSKEFIAINPKSARYCLQLSRRNLRKIVGILTGHCNLRKHLNRLGLYPDPICRACETEEETAEHMLLECPALSNLRESVLGEGCLATTDIHRVPLAAVMAFANAVGWLDCDKA